MEEDVVIHWQALDLSPGVQLKRKRRDHMSKEDPVHDWENCRNSWICLGSSLILDWQQENLHGTEVGALNVGDGYGPSSVEGASSGARTHPGSMNWVFGGHYLCWDTLPSLIQGRGALPCINLVSPTLVTLQGRTHSLWAANQGWNGMKRGGGRKRRRGPWGWNVQIIKKEKNHLNIALYLLEVSFFFTHAVSFGSENIWKY